MLYQLDFFCMDDKHIATYNVNGFDRQMRPTTSVGLILHYDYMRGSLHV